MNEVVKVWLEIGVVVLVVYIASTGMNIGVRSVELLAVIIPLSYYLPMEGKHFKGHFKQYKENDIDDKN